MRVSPSIFLCGKSSRALMAGIIGGCVATFLSAATGELQSTPLAVRPSASPARLFTLLAPEETGIQATNDYADPKMWDSLYHEFEVGAVGTGVAVADFDNDGRPDVFIVSKTESCRLFRNLGGWKFTDVTEAAGVVDRGDAAKIWKQGAAFADVNNDGWPDLYVCRFGAPNLLYMNQRDGTFREEAGPRGLALNDASGMAAFCDYDRDGWLDVFVQTNLRHAAAQPDGQPDHLYRNRGDGTFVDVTAAAGIAAEPTQGHAAIWWDYDEDGWPDLYLANDFKGPDRLYCNQRNGTFRDVAAALLPHTPYSAMGADLGDVDNDGHADFLVADMAASSAVKDRRGMAASRAGATKDPAPGADGAPQYLRNALYLHSGPARFREAAFLAGLDATDWTWSVRFEDFDNDGRLDAWFTTGMVRELHNTDLLNRMMGTESARERVKVMQNSPPLSEPNLAFRNLGDLRFENIGPAWGLDQGGVSFGAATGDFDGDGDLDVVFANYRAGPTVLRNDGASGHRCIVALRGTTSNRFGVGAHVRLETDAGVQVRDLVLARGYLSTSEPVLHFGLGAAGKIRRLTVSWPSGHTQTFADLPADQGFTITEPTGAAVPAAQAASAERQFTEVGAAVGFQLTAREEPVDETALQPLLPLRFNARGPALAAGDFNADGRIDLVLAGTPTDPLRLLAGRPGGFSAALSMTPVQARVNDGPVLLFDANGDGHADLLVTRGGAALPAGMPDYQPQLWLGDGRGGLDPAAAGSLPEWRTSTGAVAAVDWNRDGRLDLFIGGRLQPGDYPQPPRAALWLNQGNGRFVDATETLLPALRDAGMVTAALWSDADNDGWPDLVVAFDWGAVRYFHNEGGRKFTDRTEAAGFAAAGAGWWNSLAAADFNGDGRMDYAVGNLGLNTAYRASPTEPALLYQGDFKGDGTNQLVEGRWDRGKPYPWRSRRELGAVVPAILKKYPRNDVFAQATLPEIFGEAALGAATKVAATEFRSGLFLSQPDGMWKFSPLPRLAQIAPIHGLAAGDFDGDGRADLCAVQNSHAPVPSVGRFDGGLGQFLRGDGQGGFTAVSPAESGLVVPGDARALVVVDLEQDGWPDLLVTRSNAPSLAFRNRGGAARHGFSIGLQGPPGNMTGIGARVTVHLADGTVQSAEITAGTGYASQSPAEAWFGYPAGNPPSRLAVRWPDGRETGRDIAAEPPPRLVVKYPSELPLN